MQHTIELSARMAMNASLVPDGAKVADVGCDHGYVSLYLASKKACKKVIAMDIHFLMQGKILKRQVLVIALTAV